MKNALAKTITALILLSIMSTSVMAESICDVKALTEAFDGILDQGERIEAAEYQYSLRPGEDRKSPEGRILIKNTDRFVVDLINMQTNVGSYRVIVNSETCEVSYFNSL